MIREFETIRSSISSERGKSHSVRSMSSETSNNLVRPSSSNFPTVTELDQINGDNRSKYAKLRRNVSRGSSIKDNHPVVKFDRRHRRNKFALQDKKRKLGSYSKNHSRSRSEKRERYRSRSPSRRRDVRSTSTGNSYFRRNPHFSDLPLEWWEREEDCKIAKEVHTEKLDRFWPSREDLVMQTTLADEDTVLEPNMFPCTLMFYYYIIILIMNKYLLKSSFIRSISCIQMRPQQAFPTTLSGVFEI